MEERGELSKGPHGSSGREKEIISQLGPKVLSFNFNEAILNQSNVM